MSTSRIWTIEEANALVPRLSSMIGRQLALATDIERCWQELVQAVQSPAATPDQLIELARSGSEQAQARERELSEKIASYESGWQEVEELGVVVKDQRIGLCDFYGRLDGALVWLCWRYPGAGRGALPRARGRLRRAQTDHRREALGSCSASEAPGDRSEEGGVGDRGVPSRPRARRRGDLAGTGERVADAWADDLIEGEAIDAAAVLREGAMETSPFERGLVVARELAVTTMCRTTCCRGTAPAPSSYLPGARVAGIGTLAHVLDALARRLTLQERIGGQLVELLVRELGARARCAGSR